MEQFNQVVNTGKQSLNRALACQAPPGFEVQKQCPSLRSDEREDGGVVGQVVTGVIEASFEHGYLLSLRIGNSDVNLNGVAFKPGYNAPISSETDLATHLQMIGRNGGLISAKVQGVSGCQKLDPQKSGKRKYASPIRSPSVPPVGVKGTLVPVVLQPINLPNRLSRYKPSESSQIPLKPAAEGKNEDMSTQLTMLPPNTSFPVSPFSVSAESSADQRVRGSVEDDCGVFNKGRSENGLAENLKPMNSSTTTQVSNGSETCKSSPEDLGIESKKETGNSINPCLLEPRQSLYLTQAMFNFGTGPMTDLLKAVQGSIKDNPLQIAESSTFASVIESHANRTC